MKYILAENYILLAWNELAKHSDKLIAAHKKWVSFGAMAPYCKLITEEKEVEEFNRRNLSIFTDIAIAIARDSGVASMLNYRGASDDEQVSPIVKHALFIVKLFGGAQTFVTNAVEQATLIHTEGSNLDLKDSLHRGAAIIQPYPGGNSVNPPIQTTAPLKIIT